VKVVPRPKRLFLVLTLLVVLGVCDSANSATMRELAVSWQSSVCHLESYGGHLEFGTGFLIQTARPGSVLLFTARHVLESKDSVKVTLGVYDSSGARVARSAVFDVTKDGRRYYNISDTLQDCAWMVLDIISLLRSLPAGSAVYGIKEESFVRSSDLLPGLPVLFSGYPANLSVGDKTPLTRRGSIAGVDNSSRTVILDAMAVGGFSGSPVFLDKSQEICRAVPGVFVGLVYAKTELNRDFVTQDSSTSLIVPENIGIARVVPADVLLPSVRLLTR